MKKWLGVFLCAVMLLSAAPLAGFTAVDWPEMDFGGLFPSAKAAEIVDSGACGLIDEENGLDGSQVTWTLDSDGLLTISGSGEMNHFNWGLSPWNENTDIKTVSIQNGVTSVGKNAFINCGSIAGVTIPDSVASIGAYAFYGCGSLRSIRFSPHVKITQFPLGTFDGTALTEIEIPASVVNISNGAFGYSDNFNDVVRTLKQFKVAPGSESFQSIDGALYTKDGKELVFAPAVSGTFTVADGTEVIRNRAFTGCADITEIVLPDSISWIGKEAFNGCQKLKTIQFPEKVHISGGSGIENTPWYNALPDGVVYIGSCAYSIKGETPAEIDIKEGTEKILSGVYCAEGLKVLRIPSTVYNIKEFACNKLEITNPVFEISKANPDFRSADGYVYSADGTVLYYCPTSVTGAVTVPQTVKTISANAFTCCENITSVSLPEGLQTIGRCAFFACAFESIVIPSTVTAIDTYAFSNNNQLKRVEFLGKVESVDYEAFQGCGNLEETIMPEGMTIKSWEDIQGSPTETVDGVIYNGTRAVEFDGTVDPAELRQGTTYLSLTDKTSAGIILPKSIRWIQEWGGNYTPSCIDLYYKGFEKEWEMNVLAGIGPVIGGLLACYNIHFLNETDTTDTIDPAFAKEKDGLLFVVPGTTADALLSAAGDGATVTKADGAALTEQEVVGSGMTLTKPDGTKLTVVIKGDNDGDGEVTSADARLALRCSVSLEEFTDWQTAASLVDQGGDGNVTSADARLILRASVGLETLPLT